MRHSFLQEKRDLTQSLNNSDFFKNILFFIIFYYNPIVLLKIFLNF
jgi:hypothetical protein